MARSLPAGWFPMAFTSPVWSLSMYSGAARMLARENPRAAAAIASSLCAELYGLETIKEGIEDGPSNSTRFLLLAREPHPGNGEKTSIIFAVPHEAGRLYAVLKLFADAQINLTRIASMPLRSDPGTYSFFWILKVQKRMRRLPLFWKKWMA